MNRMNGLTLSMERRKLLAFFIIVTVGLMVSSMDIYLPAMPIMRDHFQTTEFWMQISLMVSPLNSALLGIIFGRLSDIYGRCPLLYTSFAFFLVGALGCCFVNSIETFFVCRLVQSVGVGGLGVLGVVILADMFHGISYARYMAIYGSMFPIVFAISPIVGAWLTEQFGWRSPFVLNFTLMLMVATWVWKFLPETLRKGEGANQGGFAELLLKSKMLLQDREFLLMALGHALPISLTGLFLANGSFIFIDGFGFTPTLYAVCQAIPIGVNFIGATIYRHSISKLGLKGALRVGVVGFSIFIVVASALIMRQLPQIPSIILFIFCISNFVMAFVVATCATRAFEIFPDDRGLSVSIVASLRNLFFGVIVSISGLFFNGTIVPVYISMILVVAVVLVILLAALQRPLAFAEEKSSS